MGANPQIRPVMERDMGVTLCDMGVTSRGAMFCRVSRCCIYAVEARLTVIGGSKVSKVNGQPSVAYRLLKASYLYIWLAKQVVSALRRGEMLSHFAIWCFQT